MPHLFSFSHNHNANDGDASLQQQEMGGGAEDLAHHKRLRRGSLIKNALSSLKRHHGEGNDPAALPATAPTELADIAEYFPSQRRPSLPEAVSSRRAIPSLPRPQTFRRRESEKREKLLEVQPSPSEKRTLSADRRRSRGASTSRPGRPSSPRPVPVPSVSAPSVTQSNDCDPVSSSQSIPDNTSSSPKQSRKDLPLLEIPDTIDQSPLLDEDGEDIDSAIDKTSLQEEFERRWILNLSMHFRDKSNREKFFVTYAERPNQWRRITISLDYRDAPEDSLEADLSTLHFQRDKSMRIYEAIRESLPDIQYYDTVTNLKLETTPEDGQLHVHVREDANEIISYPPISLFNHVQCPRFNENALDFDSHLSGFVYKVRLGGRVVIKKEIPGPDTVDEFLYEVNALDALLGTHNVVQLEGLVTDDRGELVKGLLISYASQGALVDMIYDFRGTSQLPWHRREKWAKQIVNGLADVHEAGFVQGDFTLSNIVIDEDDNAQIIDINRRGCPVGWEPPELGRLIDSGQRIGMCIGVKTDLFQLGMVLWALAEEVDEPERVERPLPDVFDDIPQYFRDMVKKCLSAQPQGRVGAKQLLGLFPENAGLPPSSSRPSVDFQHDMQVSDHSEATTHRSAKEYIDPELAMTIDEVKDCRRGEAGPSQYNSDQVTYVNPDSNPASSTYRFESSGSWVIGRRSRGRSPVSSRRRRSSPYGRTASSATSLSEQSPSGRVERRPPSPLTDKRLTNIQASATNPTDLTHTDSGFDEMMDSDFDLDRSHLTETETPRVERRKIYVPEDDDESSREDVEEPRRMSPLRREERRIQVGTGQDQGQNEAFVGGEEEKSGGGGEDA
ncbi:hypothetical protein M409DRAFT_63275 [Zasmidium cellare ATCC 36951]|uniref:non-specific serine/threonine protein kinase n=1 Tax=Zasmidium cellare ATCC 36951 TaxID=1080233 RepID=A0A6A6D0F8_ZASCE|nr:uncharacterized protein M409DRAFT_63275 [Zasmidium cellare ATCC 36951]KAF2171642.1 hypothetical protein M409DRAFT_63275 [Zasmidium cellare ATCC 36951]